MPESRWVVHKFGGTSVANAARYKVVAGIVKTEPGARKAIVVSAMSKVTDALIELVQLACKRDESYLPKLGVLKEKHLAAVKELVPAEEASALGLVLEKDFADITEVLRGAWLVREASERVLESVSGYGEIWSAQFLDARLRADGLKSTWLDARKVLVVEPGAAGIATPKEGAQPAPVAVDWQQSRARVAEWLKGVSEEYVVVTGFVASTPEGIATTLKRNGSDYSASIFGALLKAEGITIWTDVDGVLSADPRLVPEAVVLKDMSYDEASELAYFGAKVVHPSTMAPAIDDKIPIWIRNTFNPKNPGTLIHEHAESGDTVKGFSIVENIALVNVEGTGMIGVPGVAQRLFGALRDVGVSVVMISQASSEHSICFAIPQGQAKLARQTVERAFYAEMQHGQIQTVDVAEGCAILAAVGDRMVDHPGVAGKFFSALGRAGVNIRAIAQGSSERNISAVVDMSQATRALRAVHAGFYLSNTTLSIGVLGTGLIGGTFLKQLEEEAARLRQELKLDLRVRAVMDSKKMVLAENAIELPRWKELLKAADAKPADVRAFEDHVQSEHLPHAVIIDCTSSVDVAKNYPRWLRKGIHVITPNKKANTDTLPFYREIREAAREKGRHYLYETTVGAGLPIINTLRELVRTGDKIIQIDGVLSGTLSYIFNTFDAEHAFSDVVKDARAKGYTEPDPRDDLSGMDVARKLVILAREMGLELSLEQVAVKSLVPAALQKGTVDEYLARLKEQDQPMLELLQAAQARGEALRYVGVIQPDGKASVELRNYPLTHSFARIRGSDNIVAFRTSRYNAQPLIVQGPGAGPEVTAGGVFADLLRLSSYLGAPL